MIRTSALALPWAPGPVLRRFCKGRGIFQALSVLQLAVDAHLEVGSREGGLPTASLAPGHASQLGLVLLRDPPSPPSHNQLLLAPSPVVMIPRVPQVRLLGGSFLLLVVSCRMLPELLACPRPLPGPRVVVGSDPRWNLRLLQKLGH